MTIAGFAAAGLLLLGGCLDDLMHPPKSSTAGLLISHSRAASVVDGIAVEDRVHIRVMRLDEVLHDSVYVFPPNNASIRIQIELGAIQGNDVLDLSVELLEGASVISGVRRNVEVHPGQVTTAELVSPRIMSSIAGTGIQSVTRYDFTASGAETAGATYTWDFGDGTSVTGAQASHIFARAGTSPVTLRVVSPAGESLSTTRVTTGSLTGTWRRPSVGGVYHWLNAVQQDSIISGTWYTSFDPGSQFGTPADTIISGLTGVIRHPRVTLFRQVGECNRNITNGSANADLTMIGGSGSDTCNQVGSWFFNRQ